MEIEGQYNQEIDRHFSSEWRECSITMLPKINKVTHPSALRPIACQNCDYKIFSNILKDIITEYCEKNKVIDLLQFGFQQDQTINGAIFLYRAIIADSMEKKTPLYSLYVDFNKAYDSVESSILVKTLRSYGFPESAITMINEIYKLGMGYIKCPLGIIKKAIVITRGVRQGDVLSPILFTIFINPLLEKIRKCGGGYVLEKWIIPFIVFADDLTLFARSKEELEIMIKEIVKFGKETGLEHTQK